MPAKAMRLNCLRYSMTWALDLRLWLRENTRKEYLRNIQLMKCDFTNRKYSPKKPATEGA